MEKQEAHVDTSSNAERKLGWVLEAVIEVVAGQLRVKLVELLQGRWLVKIVLIVVDEADPV